MAWFDKCKKAPWQPPNVVFAIVWPILYTLYAIIFFLQRKNVAARNILLIGLVMNLSWVPLYTMNVRAALALLMAMIAVGVKTLMTLNTSFTKLLFSPYFLWLCFAFTLNAYTAVTCV
jgi:tryptophan-rich sensory protein